MSDPSDDHSATDVALSILRLARAMRSAARPDASVSPSSLSLLVTLNRSGPMPAARLATEEKLQPQSLTRMIAALENRGLIARESDPQDGRALLIRITGEGRAALSRDVAARRAWLSQAMDRVLTPEERLQLQGAAPVMSKLAGQSPAPGPERSFRRIQGRAPAREAAVVPSVYYEDARAGLAWLEQRLGFELIEAWEGPRGDVAFAQMAFCGGLVFVSTRSRDTAWSAAGNASICLVAPDADDVKRRFEVARAAGADFVRDLHLSVSPAFPEGVQQFDLRDPEGNLWTVSHYRPQGGAVPSA